MMRPRVWMFLSALLALLIVGASGLSLLAQEATPVVGGLPECTVPGAESHRLYMPDGQLISHGLTVYVTTNLTPGERPLLRLLRSHAITQAGEDEDKPLEPVLVVPNQQWTETYLGRQVTPTGTILIFDTSAMSLAGRAMVRVRPLLY